MSRDDDLLGERPTSPASGDDDLLAAFSAAARQRAPIVSPFDTARAQRDLDDAIDRDERSRRAAWSRPIAIIAVAAAGLAGAGAAAFVLWAAPKSEPVVVVTPVSAPAPIVSVPAPPTPQKLPVLVETIEPAPLPAPAPVRARTWRERAQALVDRGDDVGAARVLVAALQTDESAAAALALVLRRSPAALDGVDAALGALRRAEAMRLRCEQRLLHRRDRLAVDACRAFAQEHPAHPGARELSFAAGRVAEDDLGDLEMAEEAYSRVLLLSPFSGLPATDALLARARVRAARGNVDEARADLRLYLHNEPTARNDDAVARLAAQLGL